MAKSKRDYQTVIFREFETVFDEYIPQDNSTVPPTPARKVKFTLPRGDTMTDRAFVYGLPGGGGIFPALDWDAKKFAEVGYVFAEFETGRTPGDQDLATQISNIIHAGVFNRWAHKEHKKFGIKGSNFFGFGRSFGALSQWGLNISIPLTDKMFTSPLNELYAKAKMTLKGSATLSGDVNDVIFKLISANCKNHLDSHGDRDDILPIAKSKAAIDQMNRFVPGSRLDTYLGVGHGLEGHQDEAMTKTLQFFAKLMGLPIVVSPII